MNNNTFIMFEKNLKPKSTRNTDYPDKNYSFAITNAQPEDKGLWFRKPTELFSNAEFKNLVKVVSEAKKTGDKKEIRIAVKYAFTYLWSKMGTGLSEEHIKEIVDSLDSFDSEFIVPIESIDNNGVVFINESTGPTNAFKDLALQMLTSMVSKVLELKNKKAIENALDGKKGETLTFMVTQTSTSGDTGPAGGSGIEGRKFIINTIGFPAYEATYGQIGQMVRLKDNVLSIPMKEAFTAIQEAMKNGNTQEYRDSLNEIMQEELEDLIEKYGFKVEVTAGSFNSVNIGRIDGQTMYHIVALILAEAFSITNNGKVNEAVPTGNFGHAYAIIQASQLVKGKINKIIVSSNENDAIYRLINDGKYKMAESEVSCPSVSMIIRYGSNVERLLRLVCGDKRTKELMIKFEAGEEIELSQKEREKIRELGLIAKKTGIKDELQTIRDVWMESGRLICPHTSNAYFSALSYKKENPDDNNPILVSETASPWKFLAAIAAALTTNDTKNLEMAYELLRKHELTQEGVKKLIDLIKGAYEKNGKEFDENIIPDNLRKIYLDGFSLPEIVSAKEFQNETKVFLRKYASNFRNQVIEIISK